MDNLPPELLYKILLELPVPDIFRSYGSNSQLKLIYNSQYFGRLKAEKDYSKYLHLFTNLIDQNKWKELLIYLNSVRTIPVYYQDKIIAYVKISPLDTVNQLYDLLRNISTETFKTRDLPLTPDGFPFIRLKDVCRYKPVLFGIFTPLAVFSTTEYQSIVNAPSTGSTENLILRTRYPLPDFRFENNLLDKNKQFYPPIGTGLLYLIVDNRTLCEVTINELFATHVDLKYNLFNSLDKFYLDY